VIAVSLPRFHVVFDYDLTLSPGESLVEVARLSFADRAGDNDLAARFDDGRARWASGQARPRDVADIIASFRAIERRHVETYIASRRRPTPVLAEAFAALRASGAELHIVSSSYADWLAPIGCLWGFGSANIHAAYRLGWFAGRAHPFTAAHFRARSKAAVLRRLRQQGLLSGPVIAIGDTVEDLAMFEEGEAESFICADYFTPSPIPATRVAALKNIVRVAAPSSLAGAILGLAATLR
jgi:phosphoserine phosphatase